MHHPTKFPAKIATIQTASQIPDRHNIAYAVIPTELEAQHVSFFDGQSPQLDSCGRCSGSGIGSHPLYRHYAVPCIETE
jgi:hypothetical protein